MSSASESSYDSPSLNRVGRPLNVCCHGNGVQSILFNTKQLQILMLAVNMSCEQWLCSASAVDMGTQRKFHNKRDFVLHVISANEL